MVNEKHYSDAVWASVETVYGAGFLSPGGAAEVGRIVDGLAIEGRDVLDLGCGPGGAAVALAGDLGARRVLGIDVDAGAIERTAETVAAAGLADRITLKLVQPGTLPLLDESFDVVFSKDVIAHVADKDALYGEIFTAAASVRGLGAAGFEEVKARDHSDWTLREGRRNLESILGAEREKLLDILGEEGFEGFALLTHARALPRSTAAICRTATCGRADPHNAGCVGSGDKPMSGPAGSTRR